MLPPADATTFEILTLLGVVHHLTQRQEGHLGQLSQVIPGHWPECVTVTTIRHCPCLPACLRLPQFIATCGLVPEPWTWS